MKTLLISTENTLVCFGVRMVSAILKHAGHRVDILFLPGEFNQVETREETRKIARWIGGFEPDLIGFSLMSSHMVRTVNLHRAIRETVQCPIIWGGIHPTLQPEECLEYADMVCMGEGEYPMLDLVGELAAGKQPGNIPNIWLKTGKTIRRTPLRERTADLDELPWPDHDAETHHIHFNGGIGPVGETAWRSFIPGFMETHYVMSSRGCPHNCTYCCNSALRKVGSGPYLRRRSPEHFVGEMEALKAKFPDLKGFVFMDDSFFYGDRIWFETFTELYRNRVNLPFFCWANPSAVTEPRIRLLAQAGLVGVHVGLESGSERIASEIYRRDVPREQFYQCMDILHRYRNQIVDVRVDVITDNPYETPDDVAATVEVLSRLKKPFWVGIVSLIFYPQTELAERAVRDGYISGSDKDLYNREFFHYQPTLLNRLMRTVPVTPGTLIRFFLKHRNVAWGRILFYLYYFGYFIAVRRQIKSLRRKATHLFLRFFGDRMDPNQVVITRVALIDF
ncbi:cobalamin-dependent protein [bacterium]|nr:cobalamin-dependent protein [candidate division CSSED10-310 bacterium]